MPKTILAVLGAILLSAQLGHAQAKVPEWFIGYSNLQAEGIPSNSIFDTEFFNNRGTLNGANIEFSGFDISGLGMTADVSWNTKRTDNPDTSRHTDIWYFLVGPSMKWNRNPGDSRFEPFIRIMAGAAHTRFSGSAVVGDVFTTGKASTTDFTLAGGGGLDIRAGGIKIRVIQIDYVPIFLGSSNLETLSNAGAVSTTINNQRQDNVRFSFGIAF